MNPVAQLRQRWDQVRDGLAAGQLHLLEVIRDPDDDLDFLPIGDVLSWAEGLTEESVTHILRAAAIPWGRRLSLLSAKDITMVCFQVKARHPQAWERWRKALQARKAA